MFITTHIPSRQADLAMPAYGFVSDLRTDRLDVVLGSKTVSARTADVNGAFPGHPAWSPPI